MTITTPKTSGQKTGPWWQLLFGIIDRPTATFKAIIARRRWWLWLLPLLLVILATGVLAYVQLPYTLELAREQMERQFASLPAEQAEAIQARMGTVLNPTTMLAQSLGFGAVMLFVGVLAQAAFLYFAALIAGGDDMEFGSVFTVSAWTRIPMAIGSLTQASFIFLTERNIQQPGLSFLVAGDDLMQNARDPLFLLLGRIDLFWLWHVLLVVLGLSVVARFGRGKSLFLTLLYAGFVLGIAVAPSFLAGRFVGG